jgi:hypothetical protein
MPRKTFAAVLLVLVVLPLLSPGMALAGPAEGVSGKMVFDDVADRLRKYCREKDADKRYDRLAVLAETHDPRVAIILGEKLSGGDQREQFEAECIIVSRFKDMLLPLKAAAGVHQLRTAAKDWWEANEADLRRRAKQLQQ